MRVLITGICGYVGSRIAARFHESISGVRIIGLDNLSRPGAESNLAQLQRLGASVVRGDVRSSADLRALPDVDWVIDCAANPAVTAGTGVAGSCTPEQLLEHNLTGTLHLLEYCRSRRAGLILLSTSRVYSITSLLRIPLRETASRLEVATPLPADLTGVSEHGIAEDHATTPPISLYGASKLASEVVALEYGEAFGFPVRINRCGVIGGPGQLGHAFQGIFSFWVSCCALARPLRYIGFGGSGKQVRDCVTAEDVAELLLLQIADPDRQADRIVNVGGGRGGALSLCEMTAICEEFFGHTINVERSDETRPYDIPYFVTDTRRAEQAWGWQPSASGEEIIIALCRWSTQNLELVRSLLGEGCVK